MLRVVIIMLLSAWRVAQMLMNHKNPQSEAAQEKKHLDIMTSRVTSTGPPFHTQYKFMRYARYPHLRYSTSAITV